MVESEPNKIRCDLALHLEADFESLVDNDMGSDVCFTFDEGAAVHAHKAILAARCGHFRRLFFETGARMAEGLAATVHIRDCPREAFLGLLKILYTGCLVADPPVLIEVHRLLKRYDMPEHARTLVDPILNSVSKDNVINCMEVAHRAGELDLRDSLIDKFCSLGDATLLQGETVDLLSKELLAAIATCALARPHTIMPSSYVVLQGDVVHEEEAQLSKRRKCLSKGTPAGRIDSIRGNESGWNAIAFMTPCVPGFFAGCSVAKGEQVALWVFEEKSVWNPSSDRRSRNASWCRVLTEMTCTMNMRANTRIELRIDAECRAQLLRDGVAVKAENLAKNVGYRAVLMLGDRDGIKDLVIGKS